MTNTQNLAAAYSKKPLVTKPKTAMDETSFEERVNSLRDIIRRIECVPKNADKILFLRRELICLENKLSQKNKF